MTDTTAPVTAPHPEPSETVREPGRALDALIAETFFYQQVIGWKGEYVTAVRGQNPVTPDRCPPLPRYSTDIAAAWLVVEAMHARRFSCIIGTNGCARDQRGVKFYEDWRGLGHSIFDGEPHPGFDAVAATVPLAICLAALAAVESSR